MTSLILYLLEASAALAILYALYLLLLRKETFFNLNRFFLLAVLAVSLLFPFVSFDFLPSKESLVGKPIENLSEIRISYYDALEVWSNDGLASTGSSGGFSEYTEASTQSLVLTILMVIYGAGLVAMIFRLIWTYTWIFRLKKCNPKESIDGVTVVKVPQQMAPFSFMNAVFVHEGMMDSDEFSQIMAHEKTHIRQWHSLDLIFVQLLAAVLWFNPVVWLLIKSLKTTHEYIADKKMINQGYSLVEYQSLLLRQLISNNSYGLVHNFNLSFIKKRITMMKIQESGWAGKVKVAFVLSVALVFSLLIVQCNSKIDEQVSMANETVSSVESNDLILPVLPETGFKFDGDPANTMEFTIDENKLSINGKFFEVNEIASVLEKSNMNQHGAIILKVDKSQSMEMVSDVQWELRKANRRKLLYIGRTTEGEQVEMAFLLPPVPGSKDGPQLPKIDDAYAKEHDMDLLKIKLGNKAGSANQTRVYEFVMDQMAKGKSNYVVSAKHEDDDTYGDYLVNLTYIQEGFNQIYQERAQRMFGKNFYDLDKKDKAEKEQYLAVRKGVPRAISVAESDRLLSK
ncbi:MAG: M56 family metallopeptidase [Cyclobacteriaceae bacterium]